jgi:hypothetical protein
MTGSDQTAITTTAPTAGATAGRRMSPSARRVGLGAAALVGVSLVGGVVSVVAGPNTWTDAWTAEATLAAPWPMVLVQALTGLAAARGQGRAAFVGAVVLLLAAGLSAVSGFFDGQLARADLAPAYVVMQLAVVAVASTVVVLAAARLRDLPR